MVEVEQRNVNGEHRAARHALWDGMFCPEHLARALLLKLDQVPTGTWLAIKKIG